MEQPFIQDAGSPAGCHGIKVYIPLTVTNEQSQTNIAIFLTEMAKLTSVLVVST